MSMTTAPPGGSGPGRASDDDLIDLAFRETLRIAVGAYQDGRQDAAAEQPPRPESGDHIQDRCYARGYADVAGETAIDVAWEADAPGARWAHLAQVAWRADLFRPLPPAAEAAPPAWLQQRWETR